MKRYRAIAEYYDFENPPRGMLARDVAFFLEHLAGTAKPSPTRRQRRPPAPAASRAATVLELAAGTGRAALPIAQAGHRVVGVDYDPALLALAARKRDSAVLTERDLRLVEADILDLGGSAPDPLALRGRRAGSRAVFDWVCLFFNTLLAFPTLAEQDRLLRGVRRHLKPAGRFWFDILPPTQAIVAEGVQRDLDPLAFYVPALDRTVLRTIEIRADALRQVQWVTYHYRWFDAFGRPRHQRRSFEMTVIGPRELQLLLERHGLEIEHLWGDYDGGALTERSPRLIGCCQVARQGIRGGGR